MIRPILFTLLFTLFFFGFQQIGLAHSEGAAGHTHLADGSVSTTEQDSGAPVDVKNYREPNASLNIEDYGDFTPVESVGALAQKILTFLMAILGGVSLLGIIYGGVLIMTGGAHENNIEKGKDILLYSLIGVGVALMAIVITTLVQSFFFSFGK